MLEIDDSGWGCLLGGVAIGVYNTDTKKFFAKTVPVSCFQGKKFKSQKYLDKALDIAIEGIDKLSGYPPDTNKSGCFKKIPIRICSGFMLRDIREWVKRNNSAFIISKESKVLDPLQGLLEEYFSKTLSRYGVPNKSGSGAHRMSFNDTLEWVKEDPKRVKYVKTGWQSWINKYSAQIVAAI